MLFYSNIYTFVAKSLFHCQKRIYWKSNTYCSLSLMLHLWSDRANLVGTQFTLFNSGNSVHKNSSDEERLRKELVSIIYVKNISIITRLFKTQPIIIKSNFWNMLCIFFRKRTFWASRDHEKWAWSCRPWTWRTAAWTFSPKTYEIISSPYLVRFTDMCLFTIAFVIVFS